MIASTKEATDETRGRNAGVVRSVEELGPKPERVREEGGSVVLEAAVLGWLQQ